MGRAGSISHGALHRPISARRRTPVLARLLALVARRAALGACLSLVRTKEDAVLDEPADKLYNEGLYLLNQKKRLPRRGEAVRGGRPPAPLFRLGAQVAADVGLRLLREPATTTTASRREALRHAASGQPDAAYAQYLIASSYFDQIPDVSATRTAPKRRCSARRGRCANIPTPNTPSAPSASSRSRATSSPARKWTSARYYLKKRATSPARSTASRWW